MDVRGEGFEQAHHLEQAGNSRTGFTFAREPLSHGVDGDSEILCCLCFTQSKALDSLHDLSSDRPDRGLFRGFGRVLRHGVGLSMGKVKKSP
jgi:hypothetical protein